MAFSSRSASSGYVPAMAARRARCGASSSAMAFCNSGKAPRASRRRARSRGRALRRPMRARIRSMSPISLSCGCSFSKR
ncbi:hypothetical protein D3C77_416650 [compost metagenome]